MRHTTCRHDELSYHSVAVCPSGGAPSHYGYDTCVRAKRGALCGHIREHGAYRQLVRTELHLRGGLSAIRRQAAACLPGCCGVLRWVFGVNEFAVRIIPFLSFLLLLVIVYYAVSIGASRMAALLATGLCATSVALYATAGFCMIDSSLTCCVAGALLLYWRLVDMEGQSPRLFTCLTICALLGVGMLAKGPVALALFGLPVLSDAVINRRRKPLLSVNWFWGAVFFLLITVPYFWVVETNQPGFLRYGTSMAPDARRFAGWL